MKLSPSYFPGFLQSLLPARNSRAKPISTVSCQSTLHTHSLPARLSPSYCQRFPFHPRCFLPSFRSSQAISHGCLSVHAACPLATNFFDGFHSVHTVCPLPPLPKLFPRFPCRPRCSLPRELSPTYFPRFPLRLASSKPSCLPKLLPRVSNPSTLHNPRQQNSPKTIYLAFLLNYFHGYRSFHAARSLPPSAAPQKLFPTVSGPFSLAPSEALPQFFPKVSSPSTLHFAQPIPTELSPFPTVPCLSRSYFTRRPTLRSRTTSTAKQTQRERE